MYEQGKGFVQYNEIHERIKIYNKDGYDYATKIIQLYDEGNDTKDKLTNFKAYTYNLNNGKVEDTKPNNNGIFEEKTNRYWKQKKFTISNIKDGSFVYLIKHSNNLLQITTNLDINKSILLPKDYLEFKRFFDLVFKKQTEQIVLKKI
ncbi:hypothetical protein [Lacinutrix sp. MEBiC02595]